MDMTRGRTPNPEVSATVEMPDHRNLTQHDTALGHGEARGSLQQVCAAQWPGEVALPDADWSFQKLSDNGLTIPGLWRQKRVDTLLSVKSLLS